VVLVYRACRIVNFAQATLGSAAGVLATQPVPAQRVELLRAFGMGLVVARWSGRRPTAWSSTVSLGARLVLTVATIGLARSCPASS